MGLMAEPTPVWTAVEVADWQAGDYFRELEFLEVLQNIQHLAENHDHSGGTADGAVLATADPKSIWYYGGL